ncbi:hypothetical protein LOTGIDRAFT_162033 [Lottia gigantea]|uniref:Uncharacterized protein n=1 Tax=Lottia gigantea TaxID=225164 RepID=V3ZNR0_LOTGI|nr:hypothetical protein LOTGIDRAFT_162033 [Lottia gigantea]ESO93008.1 hypothetical protein LOTGIDRAFT_162033 [Lottia gigantea]
MTSIRNLEEELQSLKSSYEQDIHRLEEIISEAGSRHNTSYSSSYLEFMQRRQTQKPDFVDNEITPPLFSESSLSNIQNGQRNTPRRSVSFEDTETNDDTSNSRQASANYTNDRTSLIGQHGSVHSGLSSPDVRERENETEMNNFVQPRLQTKWTSTPAGTVPATACSDLGSQNAYAVRDRRPYQDYDRRMDQPQYNYGRKPISMPNKYDGCSSLEDYLIQFEVSARINRWNNREKAEFLAVSLVGPAQELLGTVNPYTLQEYGALVEALRQRFSPPQLTELNRVTFQKKTTNGDVA